MPFDSIVFFIWIHITAKHGISSSYAPRTYTNTFGKCVRACFVSVWSKYRKKKAKKATDRGRGWRERERVNAKMKLQANWIHKANIYTYYQMASSLYAEGQNESFWSAIHSFTPNPCTFLNLPPPKPISIILFPKFVAKIILLEAYGSSLAYLIIPHLMIFCFFPSFSSLHLHFILYRHLWKCRY